MGGFAVAHIFHLSAETYWNQNDFKSYNLTRTLICHQKGKRARKSKMTMSTVKPASTYAAKPTAAAPPEDSDSSIRRLRRWFWRWLWLWRKLIRIRFWGRYDFHLKTSGPKKNRGNWMTSKALAARSKTIYKVPFAVILIMSIQGKRSFWIIFVKQIYKRMKLVLGWISSTDHCVLELRHV